MAPAKYIGTGQAYIPGGDVQEVGGRSRPRGQFLRTPVPAVRDSGLDRLLRPRFELDRPVRRPAGPLDLRHGGVGGCGHDDEPQEDDDRPGNPQANR